jgi:hypothetical protein
VAHSNQNDQKVQKLTENYKKCDKKRKWKNSSNKKKLL